jgi:hypothetical protein
MHSPNPVLSMKAQKVPFMLDQSVARAAHLAPHALGLAASLFTLLPRNGTLGQVEMFESVECGVAVCARGRERRGWVM